MGQSNFIVGALFIGFVVYITMKGELPTYLGFFGLGGTTQAVPATVTSSAAGTGTTSSVLGAVGALPGIASGASSLNTAIGNLDTGNSDNFGGTFD